MRLKVDDSFNAFHFASHTRPEQNYFIMFCLLNEAMGKIPTGEVQNAVIKYLKN